MRGGSVHDGMVEGQLVVGQRAPGSWRLQTSVELFQPRMLEKLSLQYHRILANHQHPFLDKVKSYSSFQMMGPDLNLVSSPMRQRLNSCCQLRFILWLSRRSRMEWRIDGLSIRLA